VSAASGGDVLRLRVYYTPNFEKTQRLSTKNTLFYWKNLRRIKKTGSLHKIIPPLEKFFCRQKEMGQTGQIAS
jgi:hypothetical protein